MDSDSSYLAYGGKGERAGFSTNTNIIDFGVDVFGSETAVRGVSNTGYGVVGESQSTSGVFGTGRKGVVGNGLAGPGVEGIGAVDGIGYAAAGVIGRGASPLVVETRRVAAMDVGCLRAFQSLARATGVRARLEYAELSIISEGRFKR